VDVIPAVADEFFPAGGISTRFYFAPEPGVVGFWARGFGAAVFVFEREWNSTEQASSFFADISGKKEWADVLPDAVVKVRMPALGLVFDGLPADGPPGGLRYDTGDELRSSLPSAGLQFQLAFIFVHEGLQVTSASRRIS